MGQNATRTDPTSLDMNGISLENTDSEERPRATTHEESGREDNHNMVPTVEGDGEEPSITTPAIVHDKTSMAEDTAPPTLQVEQNTAEPGTPDPHSGETRRLRSQKKEGLSESGSGIENGPNRSANAAQSDKVASTSQRTRSSRTQGKVQQTDKISKSTHSPQKKQQQQTAANSNKKTLWDEKEIVKILKHFALEYSSIDPLISTFPDKLLDYIKSDSAPRQLNDEEFYQSWLFLNRLHFEEAVGMPLISKRLVQALDGIFISIEIRLAKHRSVWECLHCIVTEQERVERRPRQS
jgi:hypothetical protein